MAAAFLLYDSLRRTCTGAEVSMPEGPEIRRAADRVAAAIEGEIAVEVYFAFDWLKPFERQLTGERVDEVTTRGKGMLTRFQGGLSVYTHNQLYGRWYVMRGERLPPTARRGLRGLSLLGLRP